MRSTKRDIVVISYVGPRSGAFFGERHCDPEVGGDVGLRGCDAPDLRSYSPALPSVLAGRSAAKAPQSAYNHDKAKERGQRVRFSEQVDSLKVQEIGRQRHRADRDYWRDQLSHKRERFHSERASRQDEHCATGAAKDPERRVAMR